MLTGTVWRGDKIIGQDVALNDIVISRVGPPLRVVGFNNYVNDGYLNSYNADGIIIATPTGSTGLQSVMRRPNHSTECGNDGDDTDCTTYAEYQKSYFSGR